GAASGEEALQVATTIKLTRALWIVPLTLFTSMVFKSDKSRVSVPWFIVWFIVAIILNTYVLDSVPMVGKLVSGIARKALTVTMFFIGASLSKDVLQSVGVKPLLHGVLLWLIVSVGSLLYILW
ncbi:MAG: putative sulfate exporter family transporter, partial [Bacteroidaceae bacterium]|nr:putative sulfate exporter family transporter [Bacteroidaceae bacterium]